MSNQNKDTGILLKSGTNEAEFLEFLLQEQTYGINVAKIRQVLVYEPEKVVTLPGTPDCILGSFCFRGNPIPVVDLRSYFRFTARSDQQQRKLMLVTEFNQTIIAFVVDSVKNIRRSSWQNFKPSTQDAFGTADVSIVGTIVENDTMMPILDVEAILGSLAPSSSILSQADKVHGSATKERASARLVYCEDSKLVQKILMRSLNENGFSNVKLFSTGAEGLEYLKNSKAGEVDIIISDIEMPQMDGLTLCKEVRQNTPFTDIPFLFFSSTVSEEMKKKCESVGADAAYSKPEIGELIGMIDRCIGNK